MTHSVCVSVMFKDRWMDGNANETVVWSITTIDTAPDMVSSISQFRRRADIDATRPSAALQPCGRPVIGTASDARDNVLRSLQSSAPPGHGKPPQVQSESPKATVSAELGLDDRYDPWLAEIDDGTRAPELEPPRLDDVAAILSRVGCSDMAVADAVRTFPTPDHNAARWWLLDRSCRRLAATMGDVDSVVGRWPDLPDDLGAAGSCFPLHLFAVAAPAVRSWHAAKGISDDVSWATLADLGRHVAVHRRATGTTGVDALFWFEYHLRGLLIEVGGLQYRSFRLGSPDQPDPWFDDETARALGPGFLPGDLSVSMHIPERSVIDQATVHRSMAAARQLLDAVFPTSTRRIVTGSSWMLDDQLVDLLPPDSEIIRLAQSFQLVPGWRDGGPQLLRSVFHQWGEVPESGVARTRLQQGVLDHLAAGGHFRFRTGWRELDAVPLKVT
jgi:hypothetical protein